MYVRITWAFTRPEWGLRICIANKLPGNTVAKPHLQRLFLSSVVPRKLCTILMPRPPNPDQLECLDVGPWNGAAKAENQHSRGSPKALLTWKQSRCFVPCSPCHPAAHPPSTASLLLLRVHWEPCGDTGPLWSGVRKGITTLRQLEELSCFPPPDFHSSLLFLTGHPLPV